MKIYGNTVGTTLPKPNLDQTDPSKGDFIKGDRTFLKGDDGAVFVPEISEAGILSWTNNGGLPNPEPVDIVGDDGHTPQKGTDYFTEEDKDELVERMLDSIPRVSSVLVDREGSTTTMAVTLEDGTQTALVIQYGAGGDPETITLDGQEIGIEYVYHILYLYSKGDACDSAHGGWVASTRKHATNAKAPTLTLGTDAMTAAIADTTKNYESGIVETENGVDLTNFTKLTFVVTGYALTNDNGDGLIRVGISDDLTDSLEFDASATVTGKGTYELDVTAFTGVHDVVIYLKTDEGTGNEASVTLSEIYLE